MALNFILLRVYCCFDLEVAKRKKKKSNGKKNSWCLLFSASAWLRLEKGSFSSCAW